MKIDNPISQGYVAISSVIVIGVVILIVGLSVSINAINESLQTMGEKRKEYAIGSVESCVEDALLRLRKNNSLPSTITLPTGACDVTINSQVGSTWTFTVSGTFDGHTKRIQVSANRTGKVSIVNWTEI